jgi:hypothetical protein
MCLHPPAGSVDPSQYVADPGNWSFMTFEELSALGFR